MKAHLIRRIYTFDRCYQPVFAFKVSRISYCNVCWYNGILNISSWSCVFEVQNWWHLKSLSWAFRRMTKKRSEWKRKNWGELSLLQVILTVTNAILGQLYFCVLRINTVLGQRHYFLLLHNHLLKNPLLNMTTTVRFTYEFSGKHAI